MNVVILIGRLVADPEIRWANENTKVANFRLAVSRPPRKDGMEEADFIRIVAFGKRAELIEKYCPKGKQIALVGRLQTRTYEGQDGKKRTNVEVIAREIMLLASPKGAANTAAEENFDMAEDPFDIPPEDSEFDENGDDGLPF